MDKLIINEYRLGHPSFIGVKTLEELREQALMRSIISGIYSSIYIVNDSVVKDVGIIDDESYAKLLTAFQNLQFGDSDSALQLATDLLERYPKYSEIHRLFSFIADNGKKYDESMKHIDIAIECDSNNFFATLQKARLYMDIYNEFDKAEEWLIRSLTANKYLYHAACDLGGLELLKFKKLQETDDDNTHDKQHEAIHKAFKYFSEAREVNPLHIDAYIGICECLFVNMDYEECISCVNNSISYFKYTGIYDFEREKINRLKKLYEIATEELIKSKGGV